MPNKQPSPYKHYRWIVADPDLLGGQPTVRGTRLSVTHILECLSVGMSLEEINESFGSGVSPEALAEVLQVAEDRDFIASQIQEGWDEAHRGELSSAEDVRAEMQSFKDDWTKHRQPT